MKSTSSIAAIEGYNCGKKSIPFRVARKIWSNNYPTQFYPAIHETLPLWWCRCGRCQKDWVFGKQGLQFGAPKIAQLVYNYNNYI